MTAPKQVDFVDGVTVVTADFLDRIQEIQSGLAINMAIAISGTSIVLNAGTGNDVSSLTIGDKFRYVESPQSISFSGSDASGSYGIWATTTSTDSTPSFTLVKVSGSSPPSGTYYRLVATVDWNGSNTLSNLVQVAGYDDHGHMHTLTGDALPASSVSSTQIVDGTITLTELAASLQQLLVPTGSVLPYSGSSAPSSYLLCDGGQYSRTTYAALDAVIGTTYGAYTNGSGGSGTTHFCTPDLRGRIVMGTGTGARDGESGTGLISGGSSLTARSLGQWGGAQTHQLTVGQMPSHNHGGSTGGYAPNLLADLGGGGNVGWVGGNNMGGGNVNHTHSISSQGGDQSHNNVQPFLVLNYIIKT